MNESFAAMLSEDGKKNSLGRVNDVIESVLAEPSQLEELYLTMFDDDAWVRMRAADGFEKICRVHPEWTGAYIDRIQTELDKSEQASIQWHIAEIYCQVALNETQKKHALEWLKNLLETPNVDWIVAGDAMKALVYFNTKDEFATDELKRLLRVQLKHKSKAIRKKADKLLLSVS